MRAGAIARDTHHKSARGGLRPAAASVNTHQEEAMSTSNAVAYGAAQTLRAALAGEVFVPGDPGYDRARQAWNLAVDERPAVVVMAESAADVVQAVRFARAQGMRIAPQGTGHGAVPLEPLDGAMLLRTLRMRGVR